MSKYSSGSNDVIRAIAPSRIALTGSLNVFQYLTKIDYIDATWTENLTADIGIALFSCYKLYYVALNYAKWNTSTNWNYNTPSGNFAGDIAVLGNKYDLKSVDFTRCSQITGKLSDLKNLKKLYRFWAGSGQVTGSKADLWDGGANVYAFSI